MYEIQFRIPENLAPVFLGFQLELRNAFGQHIHQGPIRGPEHFAVPIGLAKGNPLRLGKLNLPSQLKALFFYPWSQLAPCTFACLQVRV